MGGESIHVEGSLDSLALKLRGHPEWRWLCGMACNYKNGFAGRVDESWTETHRRKAQCFHPDLNDPATVGSIWRIFWDDMPRGTVTRVLTDHGQTTVSIEMPGLRGGWRNCHMEMFAENPGLVAAAALLWMWSRKKRLNARRMAQC